MQHSFKYFGRANTFIAIILFAVLTFFTSCGPDDFGACFTASDNNVSPNEIVTFTNCTNFNGGNQTCSWDFGDGDSTTTFGNAPVQHSFSSIGQFEVKLIVGEGAKQSKHTLAINVF